MKPQLKLVKPVGKTDESVPKAPFEWNVEGAQVHLKLPKYATLCVRENWHWHRIHSGREWSLYGISNQGTMNFSIPLRNPVRIELHGQKWVLELPTIPTARRPFERFRGKGVYVYSTVAHLASFVLLVAIYRSGILDSIKNPGSVVTLNQSFELSAADGAGMPALTPFEGMSFSEFNRRLSSAIPKPTELDQLLKNFRRLGFAKRAPGMFSQAELKGAQGGMTTGGELTQNIQAQNFSKSNAAATATPTKISAADQQALRLKFKDLQEDFRRAYSRLLSQDPNFSVTIAYEAKVLPTGFLTFGDFKARGRYKPHVLASLKQEMGEKIKNVFVGAKFSGLVVRTENVFIR